MTKFIGIDLAWQSDKNHSGAAAFSAVGEDISLSAVSDGIATIDQVLAFVEQHTEADTVVAIDAPLIIANVDNQRPCERLIGQRFGARHASAHSSNLTKYPDAASVRLGKELERRGFEHCAIPHDCHRSGCWFFEVYPHPAHLVLFDLPRIIKYKKGTVVEKKAGLDQMRRAMVEHLSVATPRLRLTPPLQEFLGTDLESVRGAALKRYEDVLDGILCAYLAAHNWHWGVERNELIGDMDTGYIVNPTVPAHEA